QALSAREAVMYGTGSDSCGILPEHIICGNGAAELMFALSGAFRPTRALLAVPSFFEYEQALDAFGCEITRCRLRPEEDFNLAESFLEKVISFARPGAFGDVSFENGATESALPEQKKISVSERLMLILGNPNNPTGRTIEKSVLHRLLRICGEYHIFLVLDESFFDFLSDDDQRGTFSGAAEVPENPGVFVIRSFTKIYAMPGIRFGYGICADQELLAKMRQLLQPWNVSLIAQEAAFVAASEYDFARTSAVLTRQNRELLTKALAELGIRMFPSSVNFLLFQAPPGLDAYCLSHGFLIRECSNFPGLEPLDSCCQKRNYRICVRSQAENDALLQVMKLFMNEEKGEVC
ncbi:MAG: aminotransferase class I/II-fold pyridoxal phosphate-dependent enzyme, partial [Lachnospiraceae bacterium]|nr:aminotransferase class I/II-fold pyridoxal phosphate-dependent enzyme [Lachnospiraceae bacterium]